MREHGIPNQPSSRRSPRTIHRTLLSPESRGSDGYHGGTNRTVSARGSETRRRRRSEASRGRRRDSVKAVNRAGCAVRVRAQYASTLLRCTARLQWYHGHCETSVSQAESSSRADREGTVDQPTHSDRYVLDSFPRLGTWIVSFFPAVAAAAVAAALRRPGPRPWAVILTVLLRASSLAAATCLTKPDPGWRERACRTAARRACRVACAGNLAPVPSS